MSVYVNTQEIQYNRLPKWKEEEISKDLPNDVIIEVKNSDINRARIFAIAYSNHLESITDIISVENSRSWCRMFNKTFLSRSNILKFANSITELDIAQNFHISFNSIPNYEFLDIFTIVPKEEITTVITSIKGIDGETIMKFFHKNNNLSLLELGTFAKTSSENWKFYPIFKSSEDEELNEYIRKSI